MRETSEGSRPTMGWQVPSDDAAIEGNVGSEEPETTKLLPARTLYLVIAWEL